MLLATNESLDNELREQKNIITNLSTQEAQNQVNRFKNIKLQIFLM